MLAIVSIRLVLIRVRISAFNTKHFFKTEPQDIFVKYMRENVLFSNANISNAGHSFHKMGFDRRTG